MDFCVMSANCMIVSPSKSAVNCSADLMETTGPVSAHLMGRTPTCTQTHRQSRETNKRWSSPRILPHLAKISPMFFWNSTVPVNTTASERLREKDGPLKCQNMPVPRLKGTSVPINNSWSDNQRKTGCQLPDFFFPVWNCRILIAAGEGKSTLLFNSILFSTSFSSWWTIWSNNSSVPSGRAGGRQGSLATVWTFVPNSTLYGETSQY